MDKRSGSVAETVGGYVASREGMITSILDFYRSAVGKKAVMAATGIILFGYVLMHMLGNMKLYLGREPLNHYAEYLRVVGEPFFPYGTVLWIVRIILLLAVGLHILAAVELTLMNQRARPLGYQEKQTVAATYASRTMRWGGVIILLFIIYHLLDLTWGTLNPGFVPGDVYRNVLASFQVWPIASFYIIAQLALGLHLYHGLWSLFQSLGWNHPRFNPWRRSFAIAFTWIITLGNISFPLAVLVGWVS
ncbi:MAG: succinate dehydrogenase cytochrome b subunit [Candidatus Methylomirabilales bacterium]